MFAWFFFFFFFFLYLQLHCQNGISPIRNSGSFLWGKPAVTELHNQIHSACWVFYCFNNPPNSDMNYTILNARTDVNARDCTQGCTENLHWKLTLKEKIPCHTRESKQRRWPARSMLYQLSYIPTLTCSPLLMRYCAIEITLLLLLYIKAAIWVLWT